jgi:hypothetical protein
MPLATRMVALQAEEKSVKLKAHLECEFLSKTEPRTLLSMCANAVDAVDLPWSACGLMQWMLWTYLGQHVG